MLIDVAKIMGKVKHISHKDLKKLGKTV